MSVTFPSAKISRDAVEEVVEYSIAQMDSNGKITTLGDDRQHFVGMTEKRDEKQSKGKADICSRACYQSDPGRSQPDPMVVTGNNRIVLDKTFTVNQQPAQVIDPKDNKPHDFIHEVGTVKDGIQLTYGDNPKP